MKILYVAPDIDLGASHGGAVHVREVARGLSRLGHEVRVVAKGRPGRPARAQEDGFAVRHALALLPSKLLRFCSLPAVIAEARTFRPDVILERYYNFGGEGVWVGKRRSLPVVLEVNSPMIEYPGSTKDRLDRLLGRPLLRWREWIARHTAAFVTPTPAILPPGTPAGKIHVLPWGADTEAFRPEVEAAAAPIPADRPVVAFVGSFRNWHGAGTLVDVALRLRESGRALPVFLMIGEGPERKTIESRIEAAGLGDSFFFARAVPHAQVPSWLRRAAIGVAPFETAAHPYLAIDFYWCPLKVLEYMAMALPVVTIDVPALRRIVRPGVEGRLYPEGDVAALAAALRDLLDAPAEARRMGLAARERAVEHYSWRGHCAALERIFLGLRAGDPA